MDANAPISDEDDVDRIIEEQGEREISLQGDGGEPVIVSSKIAFQSVLVKDAMRESDQDQMEITRVPGNVLRKVVEFMEHHAMVERMHDVPDVILTHDFNQAVEIQWYRDFINEMDRDLLYQVFSAANYMLVKPLLNLICLFVTFQLTGKNADEIRELFSFPELSPEQEKAARQELAWIFDDA